ncbi:serine protease [Grimontia sp. AD028]|uniref:serine protease n=1 Tax=Grimontia sp. AD028 TaxID=1581149 RepID=UPI000AD8D0E3|nr:serine protease [Grimontia sp. AD028]
MINSSSVKVLGGILASTSFLGTAIAAENVPAPAIVDGAYVQIGDVPWQAALIDDSGKFCGGIIISQRHVLTAAHCVIDVSTSTLNVVTGYEDVAYIPDENISAVSKIDVHPDYDNEWLTSDIAVIHLASNIATTASPIAIATQTTQIDLDAQFAAAERENLFVSGWGRVATEEKGSRFLQYTLLNGEEDFTCYGNDVNGRHDSFICANSERSTGVCQGDSGGPLVWQNPSAVANKDKGYVAVGVVSYTSFYGCGLTDYADGFSQIATFYDWIDEKVGGYERPDVTFTTDIFNLGSDYAPDTTIPLTQSTSGGGGSLPLWLLTLMLPVILIRASRNKAIS